jgi:hypothetical protein
VSALLANPNSGYKCGFGLLATDTVRRWCACGSVALGVPTGYLQSNSFVMLGNVPPPVRTGLSVDLVVEAVA